VGIDCAGELLRLGLDKIRAQGLARSIRLARGDATAMPLPDASFDAAMVAFGIRNVIDPARACAEFRRVLRPGGRLAILEFGTPTLPGLRQIYGWYFRNVLPRIGRLVSRHADAYSYLPASVESFPSGAAFARVLEQAGFSRVRSLPLTLGVVYLYLAEK
jgi:demethylmenaquinone methyltransferase/2-methoxy-6-polyprenyl-1,4-benzoquinol methylase